MRRGDYLVLAWPAADHVAADRAAELGRRLAGEAEWRGGPAVPGLQIWTASERRLEVRALPHAAGFVLGDLHPMPSGEGAHSPLQPDGPSVHGPLALAGALSRAHWGGFVAVLRDADGPGAALYRDPSGDLEAHAWSLGGRLQVCASSVRLAPTWLWPPRMAMNWDRIAGHLANPTAARWDSLFDGVTTIHPGALAWLLQDRAPEPVWRPADFVGDGRMDLAGAGERLGRLVDEATAALVEPHERLLIELSGGLDSAIVAGALSAQGLAPRVAQWVNRFGDRPEGDERAFARAVTDRIGAELTAAAKPLTPLDLQALEELSSAFRPALAGADPARDRDMAARLSETGSTAILSGQGGDAIFYQMPSSLIFADALHRDGLRALGSPLLGKVARRRRASVWAVLREAWPAWRGGVALPSAVTSLLSADVRAANLDRPEPWLAGAEGLAPGKRLQIAAIGVGQVHRMDCRRRRLGDLIFPLLAQPVVELCLGIATTDLAGEDYDRPFARRVFADRIPAAIRDRRGKGNLTSYFARWVAGSAEVLRPYLLEGRLCAAGVLDRRRIEQALDPQQLIWAPEPGDLVGAAMAEAWVRHWQGRVPDSSAAPRRTAPA